MKKILFFVCSLFMCICVSAQILRSEELEKYAKEKYGEKWDDAAEEISSSIQLDKNKAMTYVQVVDCGEQTKEQLYIILNYWVSNTFNDANSVIQLNDKESGCIIAQGFIEGIASHTGGGNSYKVNLKPIIKIDIKDKKIRVTYTVPYYDVDKFAGGGIIGAIGGTIPTKVEEKWVLDKCYPFVQKDKHKKTSCKALVMAHAYSNVVMDKIEEAVKNGLVGNENDNW